MTAIAQQPKVVQSLLGEQFAELEAKSRNEFDESGWAEFSERIIDYINDLYVGARREYISRVNNEVTLKYSGKDVERASMRLDFQRLYRRKQKRYCFQIGALVGSLFTGIIAAWAVADINGKNPSVFPWVMLIIVLGITIVISSLSFIKGMEP